MSKRTVLTLLALVNLLLFSSCVFMSEHKRADSRMEQIISAIKNKDSEALTSLFSKQALDGAVDINDETEYLFNFIQGDISSWKRDGFASDKSIDYGKSSLMIRFTITINTDKDDYEIYVIDYNKDTLNPDNEGVYMLEVSKSSYNGEWDYWQNRMRAGISIVE